jgi:hypothetical protein
MYTIVKNTKTGQRGKVVDSEPLRARVVYDGEKYGQWVAWDDLEILFK